jgi:TonB family protein
MQDLDRELKSLVGRKLIFPAGLNETEVKLFQKDLIKPTLNSCSSAVEIRSVTLKNNELLFELEYIGRLSSQGAPNSCVDHMSGTHLTIAGVSPPEATEVLRLVWQNVLLAPEAFIALQSQGLTGNPEVRKTPGNQSNPRAVLQVFPSYTPAAKESRLDGTVEVEVVIGADGFIHSPKITKSLDPDLDKQALRVLSLWRFEPGRKAGNPIAVTARLEFAFHVF